MNRNKEPEGRRRAQRTTRDQYRAYVEFVEANPDIMSLKASTEAQNEYVADLNNRLNDCGPAKQLHEFKKVFSEWKSNLRKRARLCNELTLDERRLQRSGNLTFTDLEERMLLLMGQPIPDGTLIVSERSRLVSHHHNSSSTTSYNMAIEDHDDDDVDDDDDLLSLQPNETIYLAADHDDGQKDISSSPSSSPPLPDAKVIKNESIDDDECEWNNDDQLPPPKTNRRAIKRAIHSGTNGAKKTKTSSEYYLQRISETMDEQSGIVQNIQREIVSHSAKLCEIEKKIPDESVMKSIDRTLKNMFKFKLLEYAAKRAQSVEQVLEELNKIDL